MKRIASIFWIITSYFPVLEVHAQLSVNTGMTPAQYVQNVLLGQGVTVSNVTFNGNAGSQIGEFNGTNSNIGLPSGLILGSGSVSIAVGPNNAGGAGDSPGGGSSSDADLVAILGGGVSVNDVAVLEFDFVPSGDTLRFGYVFASEEYNEYVCSQFNDAFGFFISGPGITGPYTNNAANIALIPGTTTPVAINTVNNGSIGLSGMPGGCGGVGDPGLANSAYFVDNDALGGQSVQYDGFTKVLEAVAVVQCNETYHIKLAVGDVSDGAYDSGVFLEAGSFASNGVQISATSSTGDSLIVEGCGEAIFSFTRPNLGDDFTVNFDVVGTATAGVDYTTVPDSIVIPAGQATATMTMSGYEDNETEGWETITITINYETGCGQDTVSATMYVANVEDMVVNSFTCAEMSDATAADLTASVSGGFGPYTFDWSSGYGSDSIAHIDRGETTDIIFTASDTCGNTVQVALPDLNKLCDPWPPNVFSPNGDGVNDEFYVLYLEQYPESQLDVFNRWGKKVYSSEDYKNDWNGTHYKSGKKLENGVSYYVVTIPERDALTGNVTLTY